MINDLLPPLNSGITPEEWQQTPGRVRDLLKELWEKVIQLQDTVEKLQEVVKRNSQNSSQPSSQDRPEQKPFMVGKLNPGVISPSGSFVHTRGTGCCHAPVSLYQSSRLAEGHATYAAIRRGELRRNSLNLPVTRAQPTSGRCPSLPSLPHWLHGQRGSLFFPQIPRLIYLFSSRRGINVVAPAID